MGNRADRRASAKIARQAVRRAKSPTEAAILRAAAAFVDDEAAELLGACLGRADFDRAFARIAEDLHDILEDRYGAFLAQTYAEAGLGRRRVVDRAGRQMEMATRLFLCPVSGERSRLAAFAGNAADVGRLEASLREFGVVPESGRCLVLPAILPLAAFAPEATAPGRVRTLHDGLSERLAGTPAGAVPPSPDGALAAVSGVCEPLTDGPGLAVGAFVGLELAPALRADASGDELEAEEMARAAAVESWHDSYAAEVAGLAIGAPLDWLACAAALAWETIRVPLEADLARRGGAGDRVAALHCGPSVDGARLVVAAVSAAGHAVGPFSAPASLVWFDPDEFFGRAEASAEELVEHDSERAAVAILLGRG